MINKGIVNLLLSKENFWYQWVLYIQYITYSHCKARLKNMLVCHHPSLFWGVHPNSQNFCSFLDRKDSTNTYLTWFLSASLPSTSCAYFFCNVYVTIMNLAYFNPRNLQFASKQLHGTSFPWLSLLHPSPQMEWWCNHSLQG